MSIPKEPRQQMINVMYLVLIALLAMNISAEILNAFKLVDKGIQSSSSAVDEKIDVTMQSFEKAIEKNNRAEPLLEAAKLASPITDDFNEFVDNLREELIQASGIDEEKGDPEYGYIRKEDDQDTPTRILVTGDETAGVQGRGYALEAKMKESKEKYIAIFKDLIANGKGFDAAQKEQLEIDIKALEDQLPLRAPAPPEGADKKDWPTYNFYHVPMVPVLTLLNQFKNDAVSSEAMVVDRLFGKVGEKIEIYDKLKAAVVPTSGTYLLQGEDFTADIFVAATSSKSNPTVTVGGQRLKTKDGIATYKAKASSIGKKTLSGKISVKDGFGDMKSLPFELPYTVASRPDHAPVISPTKMNVFYIGVDNPVTASLTGIRSDKTSASISGGGGSMNKAGGAGEYTVRVTSPGKAKVTVSGKAKDGSPVSGSMDFRVKYIPDPIPQIGGKSGGKMGTGEMKAQQGVLAVLKDFEFDARFNVVGFELTLAERGQDLLTAVNQGGKFSGKVRNLIDRAKVGSIYYLDNIKAKGPDGKTRTLPTISFKVK